MTNLIDIPGAAPAALKNLTSVFAEMDAAYDAVASRMGFHCDGCAENCCETRFYHHTWIEFYYLVQGLATLPSDTLRTVVEAAGAVARQQAQPNPGRIMCPLNHDGRCILYTWRPMICRLHGIPHELRPPGKDIMRSPGCEHYDAVKNRDMDSFLDRTPHYGKLANLERGLREALHVSGGRRETIAEMILSALVTGNT